MGDSFAFWFSLIGGSPFVGAVPTATSVPGPPAKPVPVWFRLLLAAVLVSGAVCATAGMAALAAGIGVVFPAILVAIGLAIVRATRTAQRELREWELRVFEREVRT